MPEKDILSEMQSIETAEDYKKQSEINDMRQHANKIIVGIKKLNQHDANRAIWELFQNAVDLSNNCQVEICLDNDSLQFSHNGVPFTPMTLDCLFKQVSSKTLEEKKKFYTDEDPVGQYGTGFMTTHVFGKELIIDGAIRKGDGYIPLNNFVIDRRTDNWKVLANSIRDLKLEVTSLLEKFRDPIVSPYPKTSFTYKFASEQNKSAAKLAIESLGLILPYVMTINPNLFSVEVRGLDGIKTTYKKAELYDQNEMMVRPILIDGIRRKEVCYIETNDKKTTIILPVDKDYNAFRLDEKLPRLFLYYPLIGTENLGCNFIFHSRQFQPTEPRNSLYLNSDNESNAKDEAQNKLLLENASLRLFEFLKAKVNKISNGIYLSTINFKIDGDDEFLNSYFSGLKKTWIETFKDLPLVDVKEGSISPTEACFLDNELLSLDEGFISCYPLTEKFFPNLPQKMLITEWTARVDEWSLDQLNYIRAEDLVIKIEAEAVLSRFEKKDDLQKFYRFLIANGKGHFFNSHRLLPNIFGDFRYLMGNDGLNNPVNISLELISIANVIMPEVPKRHVDHDFQFSLDLSDYNRKNYATEILDVIASKVNDNTLAEELEDDFLDKVIDYCKLNANLDSASVPAEMAKLVSRLYTRDETLILLPQIEEDKLDLRPVQRLLVRLMLNDLSKKSTDWVAENIEYLKEILNISGFDAYKEMFGALPVFPNQLNELCKQASLEIDAPVPSEILDLYDTVLKPNLPIRTGLVHNGFSDFLKVKEKKTIRNVTEKIEGVFFGDNDLINLNSHPYKPEILKIVDTFKSNSDYANYYPLIHAQRSSILVNLANGEDSFAILSMHPDKINELATLGNDPNFDQILTLGRAAVLAKQHETANFDHKYMLGRHIERILRDGLKEILAEEVKADVKDVQNGQDIIIRIKETPVYFIEVKSRWDSDNPIRMSKNQTQKAFKEKHRYALCSVDLTEYDGEDALKVEDISEIENCMYFGRDIGDRVSHLIDILDEVDMPDSINLDGDFRTRIPMSYVVSGESLKVFESFLIEFLQQKIADGALLI
ncbi:sacsin N-terminal ATP-binding-like domain-containing protein [Pedobacter borealis]|uniref:sacsin N-terminal ATP-binding-like domain-containing protein n=1 Tax=Pedobacter borealis TaxID=475254 RepID=UPI0004934FAC|nr:DUF3883 domain-containing protein [Pedobacter borealis]